MSADRLGARGSKHDTHPKNRERRKGNKSALCDHTCLCRPGSETEGWLLVSIALLLLPVPTERHPRHEPQPRHRSFPFGSYVPPALVLLGRHSCLLASSVVAVLLPESAETWIGKTRARLCVLACVALSRCVKWAALPRRQKGATVGFGLSMRKLSIEIPGASACAILGKEVEIWLDSTVH